MLTGICEIVASLVTGDYYGAGYGVGQLGVDLIVAVAVTGATMGAGGMVGIAASSSVRVVGAAARAFASVASKVTKATGGVGCSFSAATMVLMADGSQKAISDIKIGDKVYASDPETGHSGGRAVTYLFVHRDELIDLVVDGGRIATTEDHPFWNETDGEWQRADAIDVGEKLLAADGSTVTVSGVEASSRRNALAYNITVSEIHTYYVGVDETWILVHNARPHPDTPGWKNYVIFDKNNRIHYSGMFGPTAEKSDVESRHSDTFNRFMPKAGDRLQVMNGTRSYGAAALMERRIAEAFKTNIGRSPTTWRGNRQKPMSDKKLPGYENWEASTSKPRLPTC